MSEIDAVGEEPGQQIMSGHLTALIPGQGQPGVRRELLEHRSGRGGERLGGMASGQADQSQTTAGAVDQGADRRAAAAADDQISLRKTEALAWEGRVWPRSPCVMSLTGNVRPTFLGRLGC
jgi:hypothetical protein